MTLKLTPDDNPPDSPDAGEYVTLVGLFEDIIDARNALSALRKHGCPSNVVSLIVRDRKADRGGPAERHGAVAKAVDEADLNGQSGWLLGLASLIVPERGTFLVAGLIGAALAAVTIEDSDGDTVPDSALGTILVDFGFEEDESHYLESRLQAGAMLVAATSANHDLSKSSRTLFADNNAVHIGVARTAAGVAEAAIELLDSPPEVYGTSDVVVTDAVAPMRTLVDGKRGVAWARSLKGTKVVDSDGAESGRVENLIAEATAVGEGEIEREQVRYVVVSFGGILGLGRRYAAVPIEHVTLGNDPVAVDVTRSVLQQAPTFDPAAPFSRREEQVVCAYFGCTPYWASETPPPDPLP